MRRTAVIIVLALSIALAACSNDERTEPPRNPTYIVSGTIVDANEDPLVGAEVGFGGAATAVTTDAEGKWTSPGLTGTVTVTPTLADHVFTPPTHQVDAGRTDVDFTGRRIFSLAGVLTDEDGDPIPGVVIRLDLGGGVETVESDSSGAWEAPGLSGTVTVTPIDAAYAFDPPSRTFTAAGSASFDIRTNACDSGDPTDPADPCVITRVKQLQRIDVLGNYALSADIDASATRGWTDGAGFVPLGAQRNQFQGTLDGRGHVISGLFINLPDRNYVGLFGFIDPAGTVRNLSLEDADVTGRDNTGALAGGNWGTIVASSAAGTVTGRNTVGLLIGENHNDISAVHSSGSVSGGITIGGLVGYHVDGNVATSHSSATVNGERRVGGLVGLNASGGTIAASHATGRVTSTMGEAGGLAGRNDGVIGASHSSSEVSGDQWVGGVVGINYGTTETSYSTGAVSADKNVGGLVGLNGDTGIIRNSYSSSTATTASSYAGGLVGFHRGQAIEHSYSTGRALHSGGGTRRGGLIGYHQPGTPTAINSYWDLDTSGVATSQGGGLGRTTQEMRQRATFENWDFTTIWTIEEDADYPDLIDNRR